MSTPVGSGKQLRGSATAVTARRVARLPQTLWLLSSAGAAAGAWMAVTAGQGTLPWVLSFWSILSLYGAVDHEVEPALTELVEAVSFPQGAPAQAPAPGVLRPATLSARQRRVLRFVAYGLDDDEIAEILDVDLHDVRADVEGVLAHLNVDDRAQAIHLVEAEGLEAAGVQGRRSLAAA